MSGIASRVRQRVRRRMRGRDEYMKTLLIRWPHVNAVELLFVALSVLTNQESSSDRA